MQQFKKDCEYVARFCQESPENLSFAHTMLQGTIQQNTENLSSIAYNLKTYGIDKCEVFKWRMPYIKFFNNHKEYFYEKMMSILASNKNVPDRILKLFLECEGLGLPKANFMAQLATARKEFACLDLNNLKWHSINPNVCTYNKKTKSDVAKENKRMKYFETVYRIAPNNSGLDLAWDWCKKVAKKSKKFESGKQVSQLHRYWFTLDREKIS